MMTMMISQSVAGGKSRPFYTQKEISDSSKVRGIVRIIPPVTKMIAAVKAVTTVVAAVMMKAIRMARLLIILVEATLQMCPRRIVLLG